MSRPASLLLTFLLPTFLLSASPHLDRQATSPEIAVLERDGSPTSRLTDGDTIQLRITLPADVGASTLVSFSLDDAEAIAVAECTVPAGRAACETEPFASLGWYWGNDGTPKSSRGIRAMANGAPLAESGAIEVAPRPVVMVHGFSSGWEAWTRYLGPDGYLAAIGLGGYAVGDGQVEGQLNTGRLDDAAGRTNTIAENAAILGEHIAQVKGVTGAQQVDLIAHSMGGLISRYYIDRVMAGRDVAQLLMLGSPMGGTDCANLPAALGLYLPATLEIRPSYVRGIFNQQISRRHGVPFFALAGNPIVEAFKSPCTDVPTDLAVSLSSVMDIPLDAGQMSVLHTDLNTSPRVFDEFVKPHLQTPAGQFPAEPDPLASRSSALPMQFTRIFTGHLAPATSQDLTIQIDPGVSVAGFALYESSRSLDVTVRGASGKVIALDPSTNGLVVVDDPSALFYLGYGFQNPRPGAWLVTLSATDKTPTQGADFALTAHFSGGAVLQAQADPILPQPGEAVELTALLQLPGGSPQIESAQATIRRPDGGVETVALAASGAGARAEWKATSPGLYGIDLSVTGKDAAGTSIERVAFLAVEAQPLPDSSRAVRNLALIGVGLAAGAVLLVSLVRVGARRLRRRVR